MTRTPFLLYTAVKMSAEINDDIMTGQNRKQSKAAVFYSSDRPLELLDIKLPELSAGQILVENEYTTLCRSDINTFTGKRKERTPTILGHEIVGRVHSFADDDCREDITGTPLAVGDRITWAIYSGSPDSHYARMGIPQKAPDLFKYGHEEVTEQSTLHGGLGQYCVIRKNTPVVKISENIPPGIAAFINCAAATASGAVRLAGGVKNKTILVSGSGMLGLLICSICREKNADLIICADTNPDRLRTASEFTADITISPTEAPDQSYKILTPAVNEIPPADIIFETSGTAEAMENTLRLLDIGGTAVWIGATYPQRKTRIDGEKIVRNLHTIKGLHNYNQNDLIAAAEFIEKNFSSYPFSSLIYDGFTLDCVNEAFQYAVHSNAYRVGIRTKL